MPKVHPFIWFDSNAEEAVNFYKSIFKNLKINKVVRTGDAGPGPKGSVLTISFQIEDLYVTAINGGPTYQLSPAFSLVVTCESQEEVDYYWDKLTEGGQEVQCGWLTDKFGVSWQVWPAKVLELIDGPDPEGSARAMQAMMQMVKLDIAKLEAAYEGK